MMNTMKKLAGLALRLHRSEQGAEGLEKILIIAAVVIPILGVLLIFRDRIQTWVSSSWETMVGKADISDPNPSNP